MARKTNFERFVEGVSKVVKAAKQAQKEQAKKQVPARRSPPKPKLPQTQSVIEISFITRFDNATKKFIQEEMKDFYENVPLPFVEIYETEIFKTHVDGCFYVHTSFAVLVEAPPSVARKEMEYRCHKIVETEEGIMAFSATVDRSYQ